MRVKRNKETWGEIEKNIREVREVLSNTEGKNCESQVFSCLLVVKITAVFHGIYWPFFVQLCLCMGWYRSFFLQIYSLIN